MQVFGITNSKKVKHTFESNNKWQGFMGQLDEKQLDEPIKQIVAQDNRFLVLFESGCTKGATRSTGIFLYDKIKKFKTSSDIGCISNSGKYIYLAIHLPNGNYKLKYCNNNTNGSWQEIPSNNNLPEFKHFDSAFFFRNPLIGGRVSYTFNICLVDTNGDIQIANHDDTYPNYSINILASILKLPNNERCNKVACVFISEKLHIIGLSASGNLYHIIYGSQNTFGNIESQSGEGGQFVDVSCCQRNGHLNILAVTTTGQLKHTYRAPNGKWQSFWGDIESVAGGESGHYIGCSISK